MRKTHTLGVAIFFVMKSATMTLAQTEQFNLTGVGAYDSAELLGYATQIVLSRDGEVDVASLRDTVEAIYREDGYFLAEVFVAQDGRTLVVDEGRIGALAVEGVDAETYALIRRIMSPVMGTEAVNLAEFERALMLVEDIHSISAVAEIDYPPGSAEARVRIIATEEELQTGSITLDHPATKFGEAATLTFGQSFFSAVTPGDLLRLDLSGTAEFDTGDRTLWGAVAYRAPIGGSGLFAEAYLGNVAARRDARGTLAATDISGQTAILALGYPVIRSIDTYGYALVEARGSATEVDVSGTRFESDIVGLGASWIYGQALPTGGALEYAISLSGGQRTSAAAGFDDGDRDFVYLRAGAGFEHPANWLGDEYTIRAEVWGQYSPNRLPGLEEFHVGGREDERGYVFAEARGDSGISATFEVARDFFPEDRNLNRVSPFGFVDIGLVTNNDPSATESERQTLASFGIGAEIVFAGDMSARTYLAVPLADADTTNAGDAAVYVGLTRSW